MRPEGLGEVALGPIGCSISFLSPSGAGGGGDHGLAFGPAVSPLFLGPTPSTPPSESPLTYDKIKLFRQILSKVLLLQQLQL